MDVLRDEFEVEADLIKGSGGIFEVAVDGIVVSKKTFFGFPSEDDITQTVGKALGR